MTASTRPSMSMSAVEMSSRMFMTVTATPSPLRHPSRSATTTGKLRMAFTSSTSRTMRFCAGGAGDCALASGPENATASARREATVFMSVELFQLFGHDVGRERNEDALLRHHVLPFAAQHELEEFLHFRLQRLARRLVHVDVDVAAERILMQINILDIGLVARRALARREPQHLHV